MLFMGLLNRAVLPVLNAIAHLLSPHNNSEQHYEYAKERVPSRPNKQKQWAPMIRFPRPYCGGVSRGMIWVLRTTIKWIDEIVHLNWRTIFFYHFNIGIMLWENYLETLQIELCISADASSFNSIHLVQSTILSQLQLLIHNSVYV